jgi:hypothetical protein
MYLECGVNELTESCLRLTGLSATLSKCKSHCDIFAYQ